MGRLPQKAVVMSARLHSWPQAIAGSTGDGRWRVSKAGGVEGSNGRLTHRRLDPSRVSVNPSRSSASEESGRRRLGPPPIVFPVVQAFPFAVSGDAVPLPMIPCDRFHNVLNP